MRMNIKEEDEYQIRRMYIEVFLALMDNENKTKKSFWIICAPF